MTQSVPTSFIQLYDAEVKAAYQRQGSMLRNTVRTRNQVGAERIYFPKLGKGMATTKARHADVTPMGLEHTRAFADMEDHYAPEYIDDLDQAKVNWSLRRDYAMASAMAIGRKVDDILFTQMDTATNQQSANGIDSAGGGALTLPVVTAISQELNDRDVPQDERYAAVTPATLNELLQIVGATSSDFTTQQLLMSGREPTQWMGFKWMVHTGLPDGVKGFFWHRQAIGHGIAKDITSRFDWVPEKVAWLVNSYMSMGAVVIDQDGLVELVA